MCCGLRQCHELSTKNACIHREPLAETNSLTLQSTAINAKGTPALNAQPVPMGHPNTTTYKTHLLHKALCPMSEEVIAED